MSLRSKFPAKRTTGALYAALADEEQQWDMLMDPAAAAGIDGEEEGEGEGREGQGGKRGDPRRLYVEDDVDWHAVRTAPVQEVWARGWRCLLFFGLCVFLHHHLVVLVVVVLLALLVLVVLDRVLMQSLILHCKHASPHPQPLPT